jgi:hypothetical protein
VLEEQRVGRLKMICVNVEKNLCSIAHRLLKIQWRTFLLAFPMPMFVPSLS